MGDKAAARWMNWFDSAEWMMWFKKFRAIERADFFDLNATVLFVMTMLGVAMSFRMSGETPLSKREVRFWFVLFFFVGIVGWLGAAYTNMQRDRTTTPRRKRPEDPGIHCGGQTRNDRRYLRSIVRAVPDRYANHTP